MRKIDNVGQAVLPVAPHIGFAARQVDHAHALIMVAYESRPDVVHAHHRVIDIGDPAAQAAEVTGVVGDETKDLRGIAAHQEEIEAETGIAQRALQQAGHNSILRGQASRIDRDQTLSM